MSRMTVTIGGSRSGGSGGSSGGGSDYPSRAGLDNSSGERGGTSGKSSLTRSARRVEAEQKSSSAVNFAICMTGAVLAKNVVGAVICVAEMITDSASQKASKADMRMKIGRFDPVLTRLYGNNDFVAIVMKAIREHNGSAGARHYKTIEAMIRTRAPEVLDSYLSNWHETCSSDLAMVQTLAAFATNIHRSTPLKGRKTAQETREAYVVLFTK